MKNLIEVEARSTEPGQEATVHIGDVAFNNVRLMKYSMNRDLRPQYGKTVGFLQVGCVTDITFVTKEGVVISAKHEDPSPRCA